MRRMFAIILCVMLLLLCGCGRKSVTVIGGADGPTAIYIKEDE